MADSLDPNEKERGRTNLPSDDRISGLGRIIHVEEGFGILQSTEKQTIYFGEVHFQPPVRGILGDLNKGDYLYFETKPARKKGRKLTYSASKVWKPGTNENAESSHSKEKYDRGATLEALDFLRSILDAQIVLNVSSLFPLLSAASRNVQDLFSNEKDIKKMLRKFPSVFQYNASANTVSLVDDRIHNAIDCVVDRFGSNERLDLDVLLVGVDSAPKEIRELLGRSEAEFVKFLKQYRDVFRVSKRDEDGRCFVSLCLPSASHEAVSCDARSVDSFGSQATCSSMGVPSFSAASSVMSLNALSNLHESTISPSTGLKAPDASAKQQGISRLLNALSVKEPIPLQNLIGYIHVSPPEVRDVIGNKMEKFTKFIKHDSNFFLLEPFNLVYIRSNVEKKALECLVDIVTKYQTVKLTDLLKFGVEEIPPEVRGLFGKNLTELLASVQRLLSKQDLMPYCNLVLNNDVISIQSSSQPFHSKYIVSDDGSNAVDNKVHSVSTVTGSSSSENVECEAVEFLRSIVKKSKLLAIVNVKSHLSLASEQVRQILSSENLIRDVIRRHPSVFKSFVTDDVIQLVDDDVRDAVAFFCGILALRGDRPIASVVGHLSSASARIRSATGGSPAQLTEFFKRYFDVFLVYKGIQGLMVTSMAPKSSKQIDSSSMKPKISDISEIPSVDDVNMTQPMDVDPKNIRKTAGRESRTCSDEPELDFLVDLLKDRGAMFLKDIVQCVSLAPNEIQDELGHSDAELLSYIEENPAIFKVLPRERSVELVAEDEGDAIEFFLDILNRRGPTPVSKIHGHLSQANESIRKVTGGSPESVTAFLLQFSNVFRTYKDKNIDMIDSLYEDKGDGVCNSSSSKQPKIPDPVDRTENEAVSKFSDINFDNIIGLPLLKSKPSAASSESVLPEVSSLVSDGNRAQEREPDDPWNFGNTATKLSEVHQSEPSHFGNVCHSISHKPISDYYAPFDRNDLRSVEKNASSSERELYGTKVAAEARPCAEQSSGGSVLPPFCKDAEKNNSSTATFQVKENQPGILSMTGLVRNANDERNVVADLCYETLFSRRGDGLDMTELLTICQRADPVGRQWQYTLSLKHLTKILEDDDRFFDNKANNCVFLCKDVENRAAGFLRSCIRYYGPIDLSCLKNYVYLKYAAAEVRDLLGSSDNPNMFTRKAIKSIWPKYRDQLNLVGGVLVIPDDVETKAIAFLSELIENQGPIPISMLFNHLLHAPMEVSKFLEEKLKNMTLYLSSPSVEKHFCVIDDVIDLVRSGNIQRNRLVVEQLAVSFVIDLIKTQGPIPLKDENNSLRTVTPAVRQFLGDHWNATMYKRARMKKLCSELSNVFVVGSKTISLVGSGDEFHLEDASSNIATASSSSVSDNRTETSAPKTAREMTVEFLVDVINKSGVLSLRKKRLGNPALLAASPQVRILLCGANSLKFKKSLVINFCSSFPEIFTVYKKSVDINRSNEMMKTSTSTIFSGVQGFTPTNHILNSAGIDVGVTSTAVKSGLSISTSQENQRDVQHTVSSESNIPANVAFPSGFSYNPVNLTSTSNSFFPTSVTNGNQPSTLSSFPGLYSWTSLGFNAVCPSDATPVAAGSFLPQSVYFSMSQVPTHPYPSLNPLGHTVPLLPGWITPSPAVYQMPQLFCGPTASLGPNASGTLVPGASVRNDMFVTPLSFPMVQPTTEMAVPPASSRSNMPSWTPSMFQQPSVPLPSVALQPPQYVNIPCISSVFHSGVVPSASLLKSASSVSDSHSVPKTQTATDLTSTDVVLTDEIILEKFRGTDLANSICVKQDVVLNPQDSAITDCISAVQTNQNLPTFKLWHLQNAQSFDNADSSSSEKTASEEKRQDSKSLPTFCHIPRPDVSVSEVACEARIADFKEFAENTVETDCDLASNVATANQKATLPSSWKSMVASSCVTEFNEEFDQPLGDLRDCVEFLHQETFKSSSAEAIDDSGDDSYQSAGEKGNVDFDVESVDEKTSGIVLSADGNLLYVKCEDGRLISCSSENCHGRFKKCRNIGRHFAIGEKVDVVQRKFSSDCASVFHLSSEFQTSESWCNKKTVSHSEMSCDACCDDSRIQRGRGRISILSKDMIGVMMSSLEMAAFKGEHMCGFLLNDLVDFSARKVLHFMTPWHLDDIRRVVQDDDNAEQSSVAEFLQLKLTRDFGCQTTESTINDDVIMIEQNIQTSINDDVIFSEQKIQASINDDVIALDRPCGLQY